MRDGEYISTITGIGGYWRADNTTAIFYQCPIGKYCLEEEETTVFDTAQTRCAEGHAGRLCSACAPGWRSGARARCCFLPFVLASCRSRVRTSCETSIMTLETALKPFQSKQVTSIAPSSTGL